MKFHRSYWIYGVIRFAELVHLNISKSFSLSTKFIFSPSNISYLFSVDEITFYLPSRFVKEIESFKAILDLEQNSCMKSWFRGSS